MTCRSVAVAGALKVNQAIRMRTASTPNHPQCVSPVTQIYFLLGFYSGQWSDEHRHALVDAIYTTVGVAIHQRPLRTHAMNLFGLHLIMASQWYTLGCTRSACNNHSQATPQSEVEPGISRWQKVFIYSCFSHMLIMRLPLHISHAYICLLILW